MIDWSSQDHLVTIYDQEVYHCHLSSTNPRLLVDTHRKVADCVAWNKKGNYLAIALNAGGLLVWDFPSNKVTSRTNSCQFYKIY